jgi:predicted SnoaL-like aldol condensation-catalyzing enzyme
MSKTTSEHNTALVPNAFDTLFNRRDCAAAERFRSSNHIQHGANTGPGREGLFNLTKGAPASFFESELLHE